MLGYITTATYSSDVALAPGAYINSAAFTLPAGNYICIFSVGIKPGFTRSMTFSNIFYVVSTAINGSGDFHFSSNDTTLKQTVSDGSGGTYPTLCSTGALILATSKTLYASVQVNYTAGGAGQAAKTNSGSTWIIRVS
jgi:hypothetical protein